MKKISGSLLPASVAAALTCSLMLSACATDDPIYQKNMADLARLEACGWYPKAFDPFYPADLQEAEERSRRGECGTAR